MLSAAVIPHTVVLTALTIMDKPQELNKNFRDSDCNRLSYDAYHQREKRGLEPLAMLNELGR